MFHGGQHRRVGHRCDEEAEVLSKAGRREAKPIIIVMLRPLLLIIHARSACKKRRIMLFSNAGVACKY